MAKKQASLHTIGYICEEIADSGSGCLEAKSNEILTAVVAGMRNEEQDLAVKLAATKALCNALEFANKNFEVEAERSYIMQAPLPPATHRSSHGCSPAPASSGTPEPAGDESPWAMLLQIPSAVSWPWFPCRQVSLDDGRLP